MAVSIRPAVVLAALLTLTLAEYAPAIVTGQFVYEDESAILDTVVQGHAPIAPLRSRALTRLSYRLDNAIGHGQPWAFHMTNVLLHLANGLLVWVIAGRLGLALTGRAIATGLFLCHPLQVEAVAYAAGRTEVLSTTAILCALWLVLRPRRDYWIWCGPTRTRIALTIGCCLAAFSAKESAVCVLGLLVAYASVYEPTWIGSHRMRWALGILLVSAAGLTATVLHFDHFAVADGSRLGYAALQAVAVWRYLGMILVPIGQSVDHDFVRAPIWLRWVALYWLVCVAALIALAWPLREGTALSPRMTLAVFGGAWVLIALLPRLVMRIPEVLNEHQMYLAMVGIAWAVGAALDHVPATYPRIAHPYPEIPYVF